MELREYKNKQIIACLWYNRYFEGDINRVSYVYPRVLISKTGVCKYIDSEDFPDRGGIQVNIYGGETAEDLDERYGSLVTIRITTDNVIPYTNKNNKYSLKYDKKAGTEIRIEQFDGKGFYQIVDVEKNLDAFKSDRVIQTADITLGRLCTTKVLLRNEGKLYGPFAYDEKASAYELKGTNDCQYLIGEYSAADYAGSIYEIKNQDAIVIATLVPQDLLCSPSECEKHEDWLSDEKLVDSLVESMKANNIYTREQLRHIREAILPTLTSQKELLSIEFTEERAKRIQDLLHNKAVNQDFTDTVIQFVLADEEYKKHLIDEIIKNRFENIKDRLPEYAEVKEELSNVQRDLSVAREELNAIRDERKLLEDSVIAGNQERIKQLDADNQKLRQENLELREHIDIQKNINLLKDEQRKYEILRDKAADELRDQKNQKKMVEEQTADALGRFNAEAKQTAQILDSKLRTMIMQISDRDANENSVATFDENLLCEPINCIDIVQRVTDYIRNIAKRDIETNDVANYLICISQGFITTFAGEPGTGKTSLCNILAKALGLATGDQQNRFVDISVERGWTSHKDFIGYYNPLTKEMEKSKADVFDAFIQLNGEYNDSNIQYAPYIILLDEANLSPIEHYWAAFLKLCDKGSNANRTISLGGKVRLNIPNHLRFLATVNFDHTTEELSPRFLDRSWVVTLEPTGIDEDSDDLPENFENMVPFASLEEAFLPREDDAIDEAILDKWLNIQSIFKKNALPIMPRNLTMVRKYCATACKCMSRDTPATRLAPLDYAFSQKILPTINGSADNYKALIDALLDECQEQSMPLSAKHLKRIKAAAERNLGFYQFFAR